MTRSVQQFLGDWLIDRGIEDALSGSSAGFTGRAVIAEGATGWTYEERGTLVMAGGLPMQAERRYLWKPDAEGVDIFFDDGRFFHRLELAAQPRAAHWCDPDQYDVRYNLTCWPAWEACWQVRGPRKDYVMTSRYSPAT